MTKINFDFSKTEINVTTAEYLIEKANSEEIKDFLQVKLKARCPPNYIDEDFIIVFS